MEVVKDGKLRSGDGKGRGLHLGVATGESVHDDVGASGFVLHAEIIT